MSEIGSVSTLETEKPQGLSLAEVQAYQKLLIETAANNAAEARAALDQAIIDKVPTSDPKRQELAKASQELSDAQIVVGSAAKKLMGNLDPATAQIADELAWEPAANVHFREDAVQEVARHQRENGTFDPNNVLESPDALQAYAIDNGLLNVETSLMAADIQDKFANDPASIRADLAAQQPNQTAQVIPFPGQYK